MISRFFNERSLVFQRIPQRKLNVARPISIIMSNTLSHLESYVELAGLPAYSLRAPLIAIEGLDGAGKTTIGLKLSDELGMPFVEFPTGMVCREDPPSEYNFNCFLDRLYYDSPVDYIAGRWSASGIAYAGARAETPEEEAREYRKGLAREELIPAAMLTVFVGTPCSIRLERLGERAQAGRLEESFEIPEVQCRAASAYARLFGSGWNSSDDDLPSKHSRGIIYVSGQDLASDVKTIVDEFMRRKQNPSKTVIL